PTTSTVFPYTTLFRSVFHKDSPLYSAEQRIYSQNGEDGVLLALLDTLDVQSPSALELGVGDGSECNTRILSARGHKVVCWDRGQDRKSTRLNSSHDQI